MLLLFALPVLVTVTLAHRYLQTYAPSNVLVRRVRSTQPRVRTAGGLLLLAWALLIAMHVAAVAVVAGWPAWVNLIVLVLAWDALKFLTLAIITAFRSLTWIVRRWAVRQPVA